MIYHHGHISFLNLIQSRNEINEVVLMYMATQIADGMRSHRITMMTMTNTMMKLR